MIRHSARRLLGLLGVFLTAALVSACGSSGGGGGASVVRGDIVRLSNGGSVRGITVTIGLSRSATVTDLQGLFTLSSGVSGDVQLIFERDSDNLDAEVQIRLPRGGTLALADIFIDVGINEAIPGRQSIAFDGLVDRIDCPGDMLRTVSRDDPGGIRFDIRLDTATIRDRNGEPVSCEQLVLNEEIDVKGTVLDDNTIDDGELTVGIREVGPA